MADIATADAAVRLATIIATALVFMKPNVISRETKSALEVENCFISWTSEFPESGSGIGFAANFEEELLNISHYHS